MTFSHPAWLLAGLLACAWLIWTWRRYDARQQAELARFIAAHLRMQLTSSVSIARRRTQRALLLAALALSFVALAGPLLGFRWEQVSRHGNEIIFAVDTSRSMSTPDVKPDRLTRAKLAIDDFTNQLDGDAVGLVAFAGSAFLVCPITLDYGAFHESLGALDTNTIPRAGTNIASAIREAQIALRRRPGADKVLVLVTDGEDLEGDALVAAQAAARQDGLKIYTIGVGTANGDLIPLSGGQANGFVKDDSGHFVKSRLDATALKAIAAATGGLYAPLGAQGEGFDSIYKFGLAPMLKHDLASRQQRIYTQRYQWPLAASLAMLLASLLIGSRRRIGARRSDRVPEASPSISATASSSGLMLLWAMAFLSPAQQVRASAASAQEAYKKGDFITAERDYAAAAQRDPARPALHFNRGTAAYRAGQFPQAAQAFQDSITRAPSSDPKRLNDQQDAYYNLGNTLYRSGQKTEKKSPQETIQTWTQAVKAYDTALQLRADDADSKFNRDLVKRKIEALQHDQQQNPQQNPQQNQPQQQSGQPNQQPPQQQAGQPNQQPPKTPGQSQPKPAAGEPQSKDQSSTDDADTQRVPGQMSREEARELLDSVKGDERRALGAPAAQKDVYSSPDQPVKDW